MIRPTGNDKHIENERSTTPPPGDQLHWLDEDWDQETSFFRVYEVRIGFASREEDDYQIDTYSTLALNFESAYAWAKEKAKGLGSFQGCWATVLSVSQSGQTIDREDLEHCMNGTGYAVIPSGQA